MAWSTPLTAVSNATLTAAQWNASVRDNLLITPAALATTSGSHFAGTGTNAIAERILGVNSLVTAGTTTSTSYTATLTGAASVSVTVTTGTHALWIIGSRQSSSVNGTNVWTSVAISGASSIAASDTRALSYDGTGETYHGLAVLENGLTAGSNTFTIQQRVSGGTGTFSTRRVQVIPF